MFEQLDQDLQQLVVQVIDMQKDLFDLSPSMPEIAQALERSIEKNFEVGGRYQVIGPKEFAGGTQTWKPSKRAQRKGGRTLQDRGALAASVHTMVAGDHIIASASMPYAAAQHYGAVIDHPGGTPYIVIDGRAKFLRKDGEYPPGVRFTRPHKIVLDPRPFLVVQDEDFEEFVSIIVTDLGARS